MSPPTILILDADLGFVLALAQELRRRHISDLPACTVRQAQSMITGLDLVLDALVVNCGTRGACTFIGRIVTEQPRTKILGVISERHRCRKYPNLLLAQFRDPEDKVSERIQLFGKIIQKTLTRAASSDWLI